MVNRRKDMSRLIIIPQYPTKMRYQEWWFTEFPKQYGKFFDEVVVIGHATSMRSSPYAGFAPVETACQFETQQIYDYLQLPLRDDDILLLNDLSFPGLFPHILFHKHPDKCFAICHGTSKNAYDYYYRSRKYKYPIERSVAKIFNAVFVATNYHKEKLMWDNIKVFPFPNPPFDNISTGNKYRGIVSVARPGIQKINKKIEKIIRTMRGNFDNWEEYRCFLAEAMVLLITSKEETYGYQVVDAIKCGCVPVAPKAFSYPELLPEEYLYRSTSVGDIMGIIDRVFCGDLKVPPLLTNEMAERFFELTANVMKNA